MTVPTRPGKVASMSLFPVLFPDRHRELTARVELYARPLDAGDVERLQVERFNATWDYCQQLPFYRAWRREHALPERISRTSDVTAFPLLTKQVLVERSDEVFQGGAIRDFYTTGGSTGEPARYPRAGYDLTSMHANSYLGRSWWGIRPMDRHALLWGHSHLFGSGWRGRLAQAKRAGADRLLNIRRMNAYDLTEAALQHDYDVVRRYDPVFLIGYTSAVFKLARHMQAHGLSLPQPRRLAAVVLTAETVSRADAEVISAVFGVPVVIEYGAAETGVVATSYGGTWPLRVFWYSFLCLAGPQGDLRLTTLDRRLFPLVNYANNDVVVPDAVEGDSVLSFREVLGRRQDVVVLRTAAGHRLELSAILPVHVLKSFPGILSIQFRQRDDLLEVFVQADRPLDLDEVTAFFGRELAKDHPDVDPRSYRVEQVDEQVTTVAGKHALFRP